MYRDKQKSKTNALKDRIFHLKKAISIANEYLENGSHAQWHGFEPLFSEKLKDGKGLPPHKDWVKNVFIPQNEKALKKAEMVLEKLSLEE